MCTREDFDPPIVLGGGLFAEGGDGEEGGEHGQEEEEGILSAQEIEEEARLGTQKSFLFADERLEVRELGYSATNAAYVWPNGGRLAALLPQPPPSSSSSPPPASCTAPRLLELGSGTGILSIYLRRKGWSVVSSDYDDPTIEENIAHNCRLNGVAHHHVPHTWGQPFAFDMLRTHYEAMGDPRGDVDVVVASDILLYAEQYDNLVASLVQLFRHSHETKLSLGSLTGGLMVEGKEYGYPLFLLNVARRLKTTPLFFEKLEQAGFEVHHLRDKGSNVAITHRKYCHTRVQD